MGRALVALVAGLAAAVLLGALIAGARDLSAVLGPILITAAVGVAVFALVGMRARRRERLRSLQDAADAPIDDHAEEPNRG